MFKNPLLYVWILLVAMFVAGGLIRPASEGPHVGQASTKAQGAKGGDSRTDIAPAPTRQQSEPQAQVYSANCDRPKDHDQADLCVQRRMAEAAERQNTINAWALAALVATLVTTFVAAYAAWLTVRTMRDTAKRELRAYINTVEANVARYESDHPVMQAVFQNFGQTPAYNVRCRFGGWLTDLPFAGELPTENHERKMMGTIGPGSQLTTRLSLAHPPLNREMREAINGGQKALFMHGRIDYTDAFGIERHTNFRTVLTDHAVGDPDKSLSVCDEGNDAT